MVSSSTPSTVLLVHAQTDRKPLVVDILFRCNGDIQKQSCFRLKRFLLNILNQIQFKVCESSSIFNGFEVGTERRLVFAGDRQFNHAPQASTLTCFGFAGLGCSNLSNSTQT
jgi:hypothetical protein